MLFILDSNNCDFDYKDFNKNFLDLRSNEKYEPLNDFLQDLENLRKKIS